MRRRRDGGSTHTLEAFVTLTFMFVAVVSVTSFTQSNALPAQLDRMLTIKAQDTLNVWDDLELPVGNSCDPADRLDKLVFDGIMEDHTLWNELVAAKFGPGYDVDLVLDNYDHIYPLHGTGRVMGATAALDWSRDDTYVMPLTETSATGGSERMRFAAPAIHWGRSTRAAGEAIRYQANFSDGVAASQRVGWGLTSMLGEAPEQHLREAGGGLVWSATPTDPLRADLTPLQVSPADQLPLDIAITVSASSAGESVPRGTVLNISFPPGWRDGEWFEDSLGSWVDISPTHEGLGEMFLVAELADTTSTGMIQLRAYAPTTALRPYDIITAQLSHGSLAESNLVVTYPVDNPDHSTPRVLAPTTPYAVRPGSQHVFGAALANGGVSIDVKDFSIEIPGGYDLAQNNGDGAPLFASIVPGPFLGEQAAFPATGWQVSTDHKRIFWHGNTPVHIDALKAQSFWVTVQLSSDPDHATSIQPATDDGPNVTLAFPNGYTITSRTWGKSPGVVSSVLPPATRSDDDPLGATADGYSWATVALPGETREYLAKSRGPTAHSDRESWYALDPTTSDAVNVESAVANASFEVKTRKVPVGSMMRVDGDLSSLLAKLSQLSVDSTLTLELYSPPSLGCVPTMRWDIDTQHMPTPGIRDALVWDAGLPTPSVFVTTEDEYLYRLDIDGEPVWARKLEGKATSLARMDLGPSGKLLLVGNDASKVQAIAPEDGEIVWTHEFLLGSAARAAYDADRDAVIAASGVALSLLDPQTGAERSATQTRHATTDIIPASVGIFTSSPAGYELYDDSLVSIMRRDEVTTGLAASDSALLVSDDSGVDVYAPDASAPTGPRIDFPFLVKATARGRATADAVDDLVVGLADQSIWVVDGATGALAWTGRPPYTTSGVPDFPIELPPQDPDNGGIPGASTCVPAQTPATYATTYTCGESDLGASVNALAAGTGVAALGRGSSGVGTVTKRSSDASEDLDYPTSAAIPTALGLGPWLANSHALAIGTDSGQVILLDDANNEIFVSEPSDRAGQFSFYMIVPEGGFYGTHLLVARLAWTDALGEHPQEARLMDWFEVVAQDGKPMPRPHYRVALSIAQRDEALR